MMDAKLEPEATVDLATTDSEPNGKISKQTFLHADIDIIKDYYH